eukprot:356271-Chlamydomonas_euryale.AAC.1
MKSVMIKLMCANIRASVLPRLACSCPKSPWPTCCTPFIHTITPATHNCCPLLCALLLTPKVSSDCCLGFQHTNRKTPGASVSDAQSCTCLVPRPLTRKAVHATALFTAQVCAEFTLMVSSMVPPFWTGPVPDAPGVEGCMSLAAHLTGEVMRWSGDEGGRIKVMSWGGSGVQGCMSLEEHLQGGVRSWGGMTMYGRGMNRMDHSWRRT